MEQSVLMHRPPGDHGERCLKDDLLHAMSGSAMLPEAFVTLALCREEQARAAAELLEREVWAATALMEASAAVWDQLASPTLRFSPTYGDPDQWHLEVGRFAHLAALSEPTVAEQVLIRATTPCWARVTPHHDRELAGYEGSLARAYEPIPLSQAVATVGFGTIVSRLEAASRAAGKTLLAEAQSQEERRARLLGVEQMLGWHPAPAPGQEREVSTRQWMLLALLGHGGHGWLAGALLLGVIAISLSFVVGVPLALFALVPAGLSLVIWIHARMDLPYAQDADL